MSQTNETRMRAITESLNDPRFGCYEVTTHEEAVVVAKELTAKGMKVHVSSRGHNLPKTLIVKD